APSWLMSGLGRYLETLDLDENRHVAVIGSASREMLKGAGNPRPGLIINGWSTSPVAFYTRNWERVHFLMTEHGVELNEWFNRLHRGENPDASFQAVFHTTLAALDLPVREYSRTILHSGQVRVATIAAPPWKGLTTVEPMAPAEVHALFARLHKYGPFDSQSERDRALPEIEAALRLDPMELSALLMGPLEALPVSDRLARLRELAKVHPEDYRVPLMEATWSAADAPDRESNLRKAMALDPDARGPILLLAELLAGPAPQEAAALADRLALRGGVPPGLRLALLVSLTAAKSCALAGVQREALTDWYRDADGAAVFPPEVAGKLEQLTACADQANAPAGHAP
ncbi:MAG: hypothetical protein JST92_27180, partial [Deltaproteobacteria bacterium]|nr:hypothetical protein [Deltaproteobacteria bacterium]